VSVLGTSRTSGARGPFPRRLRPNLVLGGAPRLAPVTTATGRASPIDSGLGQRVDHDREAGRPKRRGRTAIRSSSHRNRPVDVERPLSVADVLLPLAERLQRRTFCEGSSDPRCLRTETWWPRDAVPIPLRRRARLYQRRGRDSNLEGPRRPLTVFETFTDHTEAVRVACTSGLQNRQGGAALRLRVRFHRRSVAGNACLAAVCRP
jgi:hypothetical protein